MTPVDPHHGHGGTYVVMPDGRRVPSDPATGQPIPVAAPDVSIALPEAGAPTPEQE